MDGDRGVRQRQVPRVAFKELNSVTSGVVGGLLACDPEHRGAGVNAEYPPCGHLLCCLPDSGSTTASDVEDNVIGLQCCQFDRHAVRRVVPVPLDVVFDSLVVPDAAIVMDVVVFRGFAGRAFVLG